LWELPSVTMDYGQSDAHSVIPAALLALALIVLGGWYWTRCQTEHVGSVAPTPEQLREARLRAAQFSFSDPARSSQPQPASMAEARRTANPRAQQSRQVAVQESMRRQGLAPPESPPACSKLCAPSPSDTTVDGASGQTGRDLSQPTCTEPDASSSRHDAASKDAGSQQTADALSPPPPSPRAPSRPGHISLAVLCNGKRTFVSVQESASVAELREIVVSALGVDASARIFLRGSPLRIEESLAAAGVVDGVSLSVVARSATLPSKQKEPQMSNAPEVARVAVAPVEDCEIDVQVRLDGDIATMSLRSIDNVATLRSAVANRFALEGARLRLVSFGRELKDDGQLLGRTRVSEGMVDAIVRADSTAANTSATATSTSASSSHPVLSQLWSMLEQANAESLAAAPQAASSSHLSASAGSISHSQDQVPSPLPLDPSGVEISVRVGEQAFCVPGVPRGATVSDFRLRVAAALRLPVSSVRLLCRGRELSDGQIQLSSLDVGPTTPVLVALLPGAKPALPSAGSMLVGTDVESGTTGAADAAALASRAYDALEEMDEVFFGGTPEANVRLMLLRSSICGLQPGDALPDALVLLFPPVKHVWQYMPTQQTLRERCSSP